jgi:hypothetical protein
MKLVSRVILLLMLLTGCDDEPAQRRAFIDFLQQHIVARPGVHLMLMNETLAKSFGPYASHYQIILDFNSNLDLAPLERASKLKGEIGDLGDLAHHRDELKALRQATPEMIAMCEKKMAAANTARAALQQPPDLQEVYDKAFDRLVTKPGTLSTKMLTLLPTSLDAMIELADYIAANARQIRIVGMDGTSQDPVVERQVRELIEAMHKNDTAVDDLRHQLQALLNGT